MFTRCPHCDTYFRITADQLKAAQGDVRCGRCFGTFNGLENLIGDSAAAQQAAAPLPQPAPAAPAPPSPPPETLEKPVTATPKTKPAPARNTPPTPPPNRPAPRPAPAARTAAVPPTPRITPKPATAPAVSFANGRSSEELLEQLENDAEHPSRLRHFAWAAMAAVLFLVLAGQYIYFNREHLAQKPAARPWLSALCLALQCEVPLRRSPTMITLVDRHIAADPEHEQSLLVTATFVNDATHQQAFPILQLTFWDISNQVIASRRFNPSEYLKGNLDISKGMAPQQTVNIRLRLKDPGVNAVSFEFEFL